MQRILVGVDGSEASRAVLAWSADLAVRAGVALVAARVYSPTQAERSPDKDDELHRRQLREVEDWCAAIPAAGRVHPDAVLLDGDPADALLDAARESQADLLVVGGRGTGGFTQLHLGSVAHHLAHHTTVPLAIVPRTGATPVAHLVLGVDGSPGSLVAADLTADLAPALGVGVTSVYAFDPLVELVPESDERSWHHWAEDEVRRWVTPVEKAGVRVDVAVERDSHPVAALAGALEAHPGSAAVVGTRGLGGFTGLRLGGVPLQLVHHTGAAVILVPPPSPR